MIKPFDILETTNVKRIGKQPTDISGRRSSMMSLESTNQLKRVLGQITIKEPGNTSPSNLDKEELVVDQQSNLVDGQSPQSDIGRLNKVSIHRRRLTVDNM